ncbi:MAG: CdaR family protein [Bacillota bacterium]|nr:CdaR family protein [Bacillota bacterium]
MAKKKDNQIIVKIICVIASFMLWLYVANAENPEKTRTLTVPVTIQNVDALADYKLALVNDRNYEVNLKVKGPMLDVNALDASKITLKVDMSVVMMLKKGVNRIPVIVDNIPDNVTVVDKENLRLEVNLDELKGKSVPIKVNIQPITKPGYAAFDPILNLSSVYVSGPGQYVDNVSYAAASQEVKDADADKEFNLPLQPYDAAGRVVKEVKIEPQSVNVVIPVKKTKTVSIFVNLKGNISKGMRLNSADAVPSKIEIAGDENLLKNISQIETAPIDLSTINESKTVEVGLVLPNGIVLTRDNENINVKFSVDQIGSKNIQRNIQFTNLAQGLTYTSDKNSVYLVLTGPQNVLSTIGDTSVQCTVDLSNLGESVDAHTVPVTVSGLPDGVSVASVTPQNVKVLIMKASATSTTTQTPTQ